MSSGLTPAFFAAASRRTRRRVERAGRGCFCQVGFRALLIRGFLHVHTARDHATEIPRRRPPRNIHLSRQSGRGQG